MVKLNERRQFRTIEDLSLRAAKSVGISIKCMPVIFQKIDQIRRAIEQEISNFISIKNLVFKRLKQSLLLLTIFGSQVANADPIDPSDVNLFPPGISDRDLTPKGFDWRVIGGESFYILPEERDGNHQLMQPINRDGLRIAGVESVLSSRPVSSVNPTISDYQFLFEAADNDGYFFITSNKRGNLKMSVVLENGRYRIKLSDSGGSNDLTLDRFKWKLERASDDRGSYKIKSKLAGYLQASRTINDLERIVELRDNEDSSSQLWQLHNVKFPISFRVRYPEGDLKSGEHCPTTLISRSDREFNGNGPRVSVWVGLAIGKRFGPSLSQGGGNLYVLITLNARENGGDQSTVQNDFISSIVSVGESWTIDKIISPMQHSVGIIHFFGRNKAAVLVDRQTTGNGLDEEGPVHSVGIVGDTGGDDISDNASCEDDTRITQISYNEVEIEVTYTPLN